LETIRLLLLPKTKNSVARAIALLESRGATRSDYEAVFTEPAIKAVLKTWDEEAWAAVAKAILPHEALFARFRSLAEKAYQWQVKRARDRKFLGLALAMIPFARSSFLAWASENPDTWFINLADIPSGTFAMGSPDCEAYRRADESQVQVQITRPFAIGRTVVTQGQWRAVMGTKPWRFENVDKEQCGENFPAVCVNWYEADLFCKTLTGLEREAGRLPETQAYRLPTEAEWEFACRAGTTTAYSFGDSPKHLKEYGWYDRNSARQVHWVAAKTPNQWGLFDMHGNVWEWCADWYADVLSGGDDPVGPPTGSCRVRRGGAIDCGPPECRSACRYYVTPEYRSGMRGFRIVRSG
jgi:formylglycine-generating enzyme required for sulfatase activity